MKNISAAVMLLAVSGCVSPRTHSIFSLDFPEQPPRALIRSVCGGQYFTTQGVAVCEQKHPGKASLFVKVPPLEGRVVFSDGSKKTTDDFNWHPKEGFFIWKKKVIHDTWIELDLGDMGTVFGEWPVAFDIAALDPTVGVIVSRGIVFHRVCDDKEIQCSRLAVSMDCGGKVKQTGPGRIEKCVRLSDGPQEFSIILKNEDYSARGAAKLYVSVPRLGIATPVAVSPADIARGKYNFTLSSVPNGPTLVAFRLAWIDLNGVRQSAETRVLIVGHNPKWTGNDSPHYLAGDSKTTWVRPVLSNLMEVATYDGTYPTRKPEYTNDKTIEDVKNAKDNQVQCAFAWGRDNSELTFTCLNSNKEEAKLP